MRMGRKDRLVLLVLTVLTVYEVLLVRREQRARRVGLAHRGPSDRQALRDQPERMAHPVYGAPRAVPDRQVRREHRAR